MTTTNETENFQSTEELARVEEKLDLLLQQVGYLAERQRRIEDLVDEAMPIGKLMMNVGADKLQSLDDKGYAALGTAMMQGLDRVVGAYQPKDFDALADNLVGILDVVRTLTQPDVLALADEAAEVLHGAGSIKPVSVIGAVRASRDDDVQKGIGVAIEVMRQVGKVSSATRGGPRRRARTGVSAGMDSRLADRLAPSRRAVRTDASQRAPEVPAAGASADPVEQITEIEGVAVDDKGFLADPEAWDHDVGQAIAALEGIDLTDAHWQILDWSRENWSESGTSPNIRAITKGMGVETKQIYTLFPKAPGRTIARIAGIPKPAGCI